MTALGYSIGHLVKSYPVWCDLILRISAQSVIFDIFADDSQGFMDKYDTISSSGVPKGDSMAQVVQSKFLGRYIFTVLWIYNNISKSLFWIIVMELLISYMYNDRMILLIKLYENITHHLCWIRLLLHKNNLSSRKLLALKAFIVGSYFWNIWKRIEDVFSNLYEWVLSLIDFPFSCRNTSLPHNQVRLLIRTL